MPCRTHLLLLFSLFTPAVGFRSIAIDLYADDAACSSKDQRRRVLLDTCYKAAHIGLAGGKDALSMLVAASRFDAVDSTAWTTPAVIEVRSLAPSPTLSTLSPRSLLSHSPLSQREL